MQMGLLTSEITTYLQNGPTNIRTGMDFHTPRTEDKKIRNIIRVRSEVVQDCSETEWSWNWRLSTFKNQIQEHHIQFYT